MSVLLRILTRPSLLLAMGTAAYLALNKDKKDEVRYYLEYKYHMLKEEIEKRTNPYFR